MKLASKLLLGIEAVAIAVLSINGFAFVVGDITSFASVEFLAVIMIFCALISGWRIFAWVITNGPMRGINISPVWWVFAALGASLPIAILLVYLLGLSLQPIGPLSDPVGYGGVGFLIPFTHLIIEVIWQRRIYKNLQPTDLACS
jgi:hypothetical protein